MALIDITVPVMLLLYVACPAWLTRAIFKSGLGRNLFGDGWFRVALTSVLGAFLPALVSTAFFSMAYEGIGIVSKPLQFLATIGLMVVLVCVPMAWWLDRRERRSGARDVEVFE